MIFKEARKGWGLLCSADREGPCSWSSLHHHKHMWGAPQVTTSANLLLKAGASTSQCRILKALASLVLWRTEVPAPLWAPISALQWVILSLRQAGHSLTSVYKALTSNIALYPAHQRCYEVGNNSYGFFLSVLKTWLQKCVVINPRAQLLLQPLGILSQTFSVIFLHAWPQEPQVLLTGNRCRPS